MIKYPLFFPLFLSCLFLLSQISCQTAEDRQKNLKRNRVSRIWSASEIQSLPGTPYNKILERFGEPDEKNWWNPGFGTVTFDSLQIRSAINGEVARYRLLLTVRENVVTDGAIF